jgi:hypothetical protein
MSKFLPAFLIQFHRKPDNKPKDYEEYSGSIMSFEEQQDYHACNRFTYPLSQQSE